MIFFFFFHIKLLINEAITLPHKISVAIIFRDLNCCHKRNLSRLNINGLITFWNCSFWWFKSFISHNCIESTIYIKHDKNFLVTIQESQEIIFAFLHQILKKIVPSLPTKFKQAKKLNRKIQNLILCIGNARKTSMSTILNVWSTSLIFLHE